MSKPKSEKQKMQDEIDRWRKAWHEQRVLTGKAWWQGYRKGIAAQKKIHDSDNPSADAPYVGKSNV